MAAGAIGTEAVDIVLGLPGEEKMRVDIWLTPGVPGVGAMQLGLGGESYDLKTIKFCDDEPAAAAHIAACEGMQGTIVSVTDNWGTTFPGHLVISLDTNAAKRPCIYQGAPAVRVEIPWKLIPATPE